MDRGVAGRKGTCEREEVADERDEEARELTRLVGLDVAA